MTLPKTVRVGYRHFKIQPLCAKGELVERRFFGAHSFDDALIQIDDTVDAQHKAQVLLHEILHACWAVADLPQEDEEHMVTLLGRTLTQVIQDNPKVIDWIVKNAND